MSDPYPKVAYDYETLQAQIKTLGSDSSVFKDFYQPAPDWDEPALAQGDLLELNTEIPVLDSAGLPAALEETKLWLALGNTCDLEREVDLVPFAPLVPIRVFEGRGAALADLRAYRTYRTFYLPPWPAGGAEAPHYADLSLVISAHKQSLLSGARGVARLNRPGWILLHSVILRFFAREDSRFSY